jgi:hypothetical protein
LMNMLMILIFCTAFLSRIFYKKCKYRVYLIFLFLGGGGGIYIIIFVA